MKPHRPSRSKAFSLAELLIVISLIVVIASLVTGSMRGFGNSRAIANSSSLLTNLALQAQQAATSRNAMSMLVIAPDAQGRYTLLALLEHPLGTTGWKQTTRWESFGEGISLDLAESDLTLPPLATSPFPIKHAGRDISASQAKYQIFLPGGRLAGGENARFRIVSASDPNGDLATDVLINAATGTTTTDSANLP